jgi:hypothetical protein
MLPGRQKNCCGLLIMLFVGIVATWSLCRYYHVPVKVIPPDPRGYAVGITTEAPAFVERERVNIVIGGVFGKRPPAHNGKYVVNKTVRFRPKGKGVRLSVDRPSTTHKPDEAPQKWKFFHRIKDAFKQIKTYFTSRNETKLHV